MDEILCANKKCDFYNDDYTANCENSPNELCEKHVFQTPTDKDINRVIAEAMGLHKAQFTGTDPRSVYVIGNPPRRFNPYDSITDAFEAVDVICKSDTVPFQYAVTINKMNDGAFKAKIITYTSKKEYGFSEAWGVSETPQAAVVLAIKQYLEEK